MVEGKGSSSTFSKKKEETSPLLKRTLLFALQLSFVFTLLIIWLTSKGLRESKSLWVLFFYSFPAEFLIATIPHEPALIYFGKFYPPFLVALIAVASTLITEALNYSVFKFITDIPPFQRIKRGKAVTKIVDLFNKAPFLALLVAGLTPVPFYPFRFLVVMAAYPAWKYLLAVFLSRTPRFIFLSFIGHAIKFPDYFLIILFVMMLLFPYLTVLRNRLKRKKGKKRLESEQKIAFSRTLSPQGLKITCLVNPLAANKKWQRRKKLRILIKKYIHGEFIDSPLSKEEIVEVARKKSIESDLVIAVGGDGTLADVIQGIIEAGQGKRISLGIIPLGSGNAFRKSLGIPKNTKKALRLLEEGEVREIDLIEIEGKIAGFASVGATAFVTGEKLKHRIPGLAGHLLAGRKLIQLEKKESEIELFKGRDDAGNYFENKKMKLCFLECVIGKTNYFGYSWRIAPQARLDDGFLDLTFFEINGWKYLLFFPLIYFGIFQKTQRHFKVTELILRGKDLPLQYNGEFLGVREEVKARVLPRALRVIVSPQRRNKNL